MHLALLKLSRKPTVTITALLALIYISTLTSDYYWDGITFALQIEKVANGERGAYLLFHQNHLLYNAIGYMIYRAVHAIGLNVRALYLLQLTNTIVGAIGISIFFRMTERVTRNQYTAAVCSIGLALSAVWWKLATDADAYIPSVFLILVCANNLLHSKPRWWVAGLSLAGAMLIHQLAALFYPAALVAVFSNKRIESKGRFAVGMSVLAWAVTIGAYYACAALLRGITEPISVVRWAISNQSGVSPTLNPLRGIALLPRANVELFIGHSFSLFFRQGGWSEILVSLAALVTACAFALVFVRKVRAGHSIESLRKVAPEMSQAWGLTLPVLITWIGTYLIFLLFWEPWQTYYRVCYAPALMLLFGLVLNNYHCVAARINECHSGPGAPSGAAALAVVTIALFNLGFYIMPHMSPSGNALVAGARDARTVWNDRTVVYFTSPNSADTAFEYFNERTVWRRLSPAMIESLDGEIERAYKQGGSVWLNKGASEFVGSDWLNKRVRGEEIKVEAPHAPAYYVQLLHSRSPSDSSKSGVRSPESKVRVTNLEYAN